MTAIAETTCLQVIMSAVKCGITDFCLCPGGRNVPFIKILKQQKHLQTYYFYDERSAGFFALGKSRAQNRPVALITTSGTAIAHLLPAAMEAYYTGVPLLLITADRPKIHRGCNTPQSCEQPNIYGVYTPFQLDLAEEDEADFSSWDQKAPAHINVCIEESALYEDPKDIALYESPSASISPLFNLPHRSIAETLDSFLNTVKSPLIVLSAIKPQAQIPIANFLKQLKAPVILEAPSGLREEPGLQGLRITRTENIWKHASAAGYSIDGILRIGGVPTCRLWRDLENKQGQIEVLSINEVPFSGLSWGSICCTSLKDFFSLYHSPISYPGKISANWLKSDQEYQIRLNQLFIEEPHSEPALIHSLSKQISENSLVYLGNSLPIREWDLAATTKRRHAYIHANRGVNGIDGQTSTFLGLSQSHLDNWALLGDLTALHDVSAPWILQQMHNLPVQIVIVNNGGGKIFARMFSDIEVQNNHSLDFCHFAGLWKIKYERWTEIPEHITLDCPRVIELVPDPQATQRFWSSMS